MAVDRGGLQYTIEVRDEFASAVTRFRNDIEAARDAFRSFRSEVGRRGRINVRLEQQAAAQRELTQAKREELSVDQQAQRRARQALRERQIQNSAVRQNLDLSRRSRAAAVENQRARDREAASLRQLRRELERLRSAEASQVSGTEARRAEAQELRRIARERERLVQVTLRERLERERGLDTLREEVGQLRVEQLARDRVRAAAERQAAAQAELRRLQEVGATPTSRLAGAAGNQELQAELIAQERLARAILEQNVQRRLAADPRARELGLIRETVQELTAEQEARERINRARRAQRVAQEEVRLRREQGLPVDPATIRRARGELEATRTQTRLLRGDLNGVLPSIQRVVAAFLLFEAVRAVIGTFRNLVTISLAFNAAIERAQLSIAGLVTAAGEVRVGLSGGATTAEQFAASLSIAREQTQQLRRDALRTTATFQELLEALQVSIAPGISAGLDVDQIRQVTVLISQAATSLGVAQNQLAEEIRSVLTGAINVRTSRIATALGITNADIQQAREAGVLFDFLQGRLEAFNVSASRVAQSFEGLTQRIRDAVQVILGDAGADFFSVTRDLLRDILDLLLVEGEPNETIIAGLEPVFDSLANVVQRFRDELEAITFDDLQSRAEGLGNAIEVIAAILEGLARGIGSGVSRLTDILGTTDDLDTIRQIAAQAGRILTIVSALAISGQLLTLPFTLLLGVFARLRTLFGPILAGAGRFLASATGAETAWAAIGVILRGIGSLLLRLATGPVGIVVTAFTAIVFVVREILALFTGIRISIADTAALIGSAIINRIQATGALIAGLIIRRLRIIVGLVGSIGAGLARLTGSETLQGFADQIENLRETLSFAEDAAFADVFAQLDDLNERYEASVARARGSVEESIEGIVTAAQEGVVSLLQLAGAIQPVVSTIQNEIDTSQESLSSLQNTLRELGREFAAFGSGGAVTDSGISAQTEAIEAQQRAQETLGQLRSSQVGIEAQLAQVARDRADLAEAEQRAVDGAVRSLRIREIAQRRLAQVSSQLALNEELLVRARATGNNAEVDRLSALNATLARQEELARITAEQNDFVADRRFIDEELAELAQERIELENQLASNLDDQNTIAELLEQTLLRISQAEASRAAIAAQRGAQQLNDEIDALELELDLQRQLARVGLSDAQRRSLEVTNRIQQIRLEAAQEERKLRIQIQQAEALARTRDIGVAERRVLLQRASDLQGELSLRNAIADASIAQLENERRRQERIAEIEARRAQTRATLELQDRGDELQLRLDRERALSQVIGQSAAAQQARAAIELQALERTNELRLREERAQLRSVQLAERAASLAGLDNIATNLRTRAELLERVVNSEEELAALELAAQQRQSQDALFSAQASALQRENEVALLREQVAQQTFLATAENQRAAQQVAQLASQIRQLQLRAQLENQLNELQEQQLRTQLAQASIPAERAAIQAQIDGLQEENRLRSQNVALQEQALRLELGRAELYRSGGLTDGLLLGVDDFIRQYESLALVGQRIVTGALNATLNGISEAIDIIATSDNISEDLTALAGRVVQDILRTAFDALLQNLVANLLDNLLGQQITDTLGGAATAAQLQAGAAAASATLTAAGIQLAASMVAGATQAAAILAASSVTTAGAGVGAKGGLFPSAMSGLSGTAAHFSAAAQAFAKGGKVRNTPAPASKIPAGLDPRDRIPAWLRKDEFVVTPEAWKPHGLAFMQMLNKGLLNPDLSAGMSSGLRARRARPKLGFAEGGLATQAPAGVLASTGFRGRGGSSEEMTLIQPVADQRTAERTLSGGRDPFLRLARRYRTQLKNLILNN